MRAGFELEPVEEVRHFNPSLFLFLATDVAKTSTRKGGACGARLEDSLNSENKSKVMG